MGVKRLRFSLKVFRLAAFDRCSRDRVWSPELSSAGLSGESGVVDVSPDECRNSTDDTKRSFGGWALNGACCNDWEWESCDAMPGGRGETVLIPCPEPLGPLPNDWPIKVGAEPTATSQLSLVVVCGSRPVELLDTDSRGGCNVCCERVSLGVHMPPEPLRESTGTAETCEWVAWPVVVPVNMDISDGRCWDLWASAALVAAGVSLFFCSELSRSVDTDLFRSWTSVGNAFAVRLVTISLILQLVAQIAQLSC